MEKRLKDRRYQDTARKIHEALAALLEAKRSADTSDVTIQELCERAGITRGTFYHHYKNISAVIVEAEQQLFADYAKVLYDTPKPDRHPKYLVRRTLELISRRKSYFRMIFACSDYHFMMKVFEATRPLLQELWKDLGISEDEELLDKAYHFCAYGMIGLVKYWVIEKNCDTDLIDEYADFIYDFSHKGMDYFATDNALCPDKYKAW